jgi:hypothetical protein
MSKLESLTVCSEGMTAGARQAKMGPVGKMPVPSLWGVDMEEVGRDRP